MFKLDKLDVRREKLCLSYENKCLLNTTSQVGEVKKIMDPKATE